MEEITDVDYMHTKRAFEDFKIKKKIGEHHGLYVQSNTLLLAGVFENCWNMCIEIYKLDSVHFLTALGLAWQATLKKQD